VVKAAGGCDLAACVDEVEGPWIMMFGAEATAAIARARLDERLMKKWVKYVTQFHGGDPADTAELLTLSAAEQLQELCSLALRKRRKLYSCFYG